MRLPGVTVLFKFPAVGWWIALARVACCLGIVLWWSAFTIFTVSAWNAASFIVIRFLFGAG